MAYDEQLAKRLRRLFDGKPVTERPMFGGLAFLLKGHMCAGIVGHELMLRVGADQHDHALSSPYARPMDFTGRPMKGMVYVAPAGFQKASNLNKWIGLAESFVSSLPPKKAPALAPTPKAKVLNRASLGTHAAQQTLSKASSKTKGNSPAKAVSPMAKPPSKTSSKTSSKASSPGKPTKPSKAASKAKAASKTSSAAGANPPSKTATKATSRANSPSETIAFEGFGKESFEFLRGLSKHNEKPWFDAHRAEYEAHYLAPALAFINELGPRLRKVSKGVSFEPRINGSLFRIQRDVRFSKDKTPYKAHIDMWFWHGDRKSWSPPGFFFRLESDKLTLGAGVHRFDPTGLAAYRQAVVDTKRGQALEALVTKFGQQASYSIGGASRKQVPKGFPADHPRRQWLLHDGLFVLVELKPPKQVGSAKFVDYCAEHFARQAPLVKWLLALPR